MVFEPKTHAKNDQTLSIFGGFYPPLQIFDSYGILKPTKTLSNLINAKIFKRVFSGGKGEAIKKNA